MKTIHSGFDTILFAVKGAMHPAVLAMIKEVKAAAVKEDSDQLLDIKGLEEDIYVKPIGQKGGYAYVLDMGFNAHIISLKDNNYLENWNAFIKIRSLSLALKGHKKAVQCALHALEAIGFDIRDVSLNRVDYAIDVLTTSPIKIDPELIVTHSRRKIDCYYEHAVTTTQSRQVQSIRIGKMPNSQIVIYDKRQEALTKRNYAWFRIWGLDRYAEHQYISRVEIRLGKDALKANNIRKPKALKNRLESALKRIITKTRYVENTRNNLNASRSTLHPLWDHITNHIDKCFEAHITTMEPNIFEADRKDAKASEYLASILGNIIGYAVCKDIPFGKIINAIEPIRSDLVAMQHEASPIHKQFAKKYIQTKSRLKF